MNFYKHHIGDYAQATAHLSFVEDAAYSRLIRKYYADERPLPVDVKAVQRLVGARSRDERDAVQTVLDEFFVLGDDGWRNKRCDAELEKASAQADTNRRIAEEREAKKRERRQHESLNESLDGSLPSREPSQTPDTRHQTNTEHPGDDTRSDPESMRVSMAGAVCVALKAEGVGSVNPGHPELATLLQQGAEVQNFVSAARMAKGKGKGFAYVLGIVKGQLADARQLAAAGRAAPPRPTSRADERAAKSAGLTGRNHQRTNDEIREPGAIDVESRRLD